MEGQGGSPGGTPAASAGEDERRQEHRREHRRRTLKQCRVVLSDSTVIDCMMRDVTEEGSRLVFNAPISLPDAFRLYNVSDKTIAPVKLRWQRGLEAGIAFTGTQEPHPNF